MSNAMQELSSIQQHQQEVEIELVSAQQETDAEQTHKFQSELQSLRTQQMQVIQEHRDVLNTAYSVYYRSVCCC